MKRSVIVSVVTVLSIIILLTAMVTVNNVSTKSNPAQPFYVGVTYCGDNITDAKLLIDRVKNYTNLFILQSGPLMYNLEATEEICDYAVNAGLSIILSYTRNSIGTLKEVLNTTQTRWGNQFLGIYYNDEPGGKMLDKQEILLQNPQTNQSLHRNQDKSLQFGTSNSTTDIATTYSISGPITISTSPVRLLLLVIHPGTIFDDSDNQDHSIEDEVPPTTTVYYPNGTICYTTTDRTLMFHPDGSVQDENGKIITNQGGIAQFQSYQEVLASLPIQTFTDAANCYIETQQTDLSCLGNVSGVELCTSDYALYWWDYQIGYDTVFAQLGWNNSVTQEIGLVRGAANMQGKSWGTIITWTYTQPPYLTSGEEMYEQMRVSYESGAKYVLVFNYAETMTGVWGALQEAHFGALERFWNDVVQNAGVVHGGIRAEATLVLPMDYGWGMRNPQDNIWGMWDANDTTQQIWNQLQNQLSQYGSKLDIIYDDPTYHSIINRYSYIRYWNQTD
ncbi:hypothetical protein [Candidatus Bathycorpusculum sp.]|uniref:hypothetical protein n=1 Tax=Candidatus Bathycorpusculum sp. TaxID=2994959 RepID=UPI0028210B7C|nr:hypothetical protein [Candidatus Termitimicrobium sp.]MCL2432658.1 hypothetical protein [Candidatus Termitimicrobium sp.]